MNPRERLLTTLRGGVADRVPLFIEGFLHETPENVQDPLKRQVVERVLGEVHYYHECPSFVNRYLITPPQRMKVIDRKEEGDEVTVVTEIDTPRGKLTAVTGRDTTTDTTWTHKYPVESLEDIEKIRSVPWELPFELAPPDLSGVPASFATRGIVRAAISSPFVCAAGMMSYEYFLELCATELDLLKELSEQCLERTLDILGVLLSERSVEYVWMGGCEWLTPPMGSPALYAELVQRLEAPVIEMIHAAGALSHVHCHGNVRSTLELVIERGGDFFEPVEPPPDGDITFAEAKALAAGRITLGGNVEARILENESADAVEEATRRAFEGGKRRMALRASAGPIGRMTPRMLENYNRMIDVWEELSPISAVVR